MKSTLYIADLFCGAGGTSTGALAAAERAGYKVKLTAINHWQVAVATHGENHPDARHLCTSIDDVNPRSLYELGQLDVLWASPECTHHSRARGGRPMQDQSRATAWCVTRWAEALQPSIIFVENVPEFLEWGPLGTNGRPMVTKKGHTFAAWVGVLESLGYKVEWKILCAADYGAPTTRERLFVQAVRGRRQIKWPDRTHASRKELEKRKDDLFGPANLKPWVPAREIIDWELQGRWLDEMPGKAQHGGLPLSPKTLRRIHAGLAKYGLKSFIAPRMGAGTDRAHNMEQPMPTATTSGVGYLVEPYIVPHFGERQGQQPRAHEVDSPLPAVTSHGAGSLVEPYIIPIDHTGGQGTPSNSIDSPLSTVTTEARHGIIQPFLVELRGTKTEQLDASGRSLDNPINAVTAGGTHHGIVDPYLVEVAHGDGCGRGNAGREKSLDNPIGTLPCTNRFALAEPYLVPTAHGGGEARASSIDEPLKTICGNRGEAAIIEPHLLGQQSGSALRPVSEPAPTIATAGAIALVSPFLTKYNGTGMANSVDEPLDTVTTKDRFALVMPTVVIDGQAYRIRLRWRMLQPHELARGQSFPKGYKFTGTKTDAVKQIGNAVPPEVAAALLSCHLAPNA